MLRTKNWPSGQFLVTYNAVANWPGGQFLVTYNAVA